MAAISSLSISSRFPPRLSPRPSFHFTHGVIFSSSNPRLSAFAAIGRRNLALAAAPGEIPGEILEDAKFVPLTEEDPIFGPPVLLLAGFDSSEKIKIEQFLRDLEGDFLKVIYCTEDMLSLTVWDAVHVQEQSSEALKVGISLPRVCIFSGLSGEEIMMFIEAFPETGLAPAVFAAMVPNSAGKFLGEVIDEIMGDHEMVSSTRSSV